MLRSEDCKRALPARQDWRASVSADLAHWYALAERASRPVDKLDYLIRRWVIADHPSQVCQSPAAYPMQSDGLLGELQKAIGQYLRAEYDLAQPVPDRLAALLREVEQSA
jgi:hypothetical protein